MSQPYKGWEYGPANSEDEGKLVSTLTLKKYGRTRPADGYNAPVDIVTVVNPETGAYDVYEQNKALGLNTNRSLVYRFNPSNPDGENILIQDKSRFRAIFGGEKGPAQLSSHNRIIKKRTIDNLKLLGALDSEIQDDLNKIRETNGYKSENNTAVNLDEEKTTEDGSTDAEESDTQKDSEVDIDPSDTSTITKIQDKLKLGEAAGTRTRLYSGPNTSIMYPLDLASTSQDVIKFTMMKYVPSDIRIGGDSSDAFFVQSNERGGNREILGTVMLPIPGGIKSDDRVSWSAGTANAAQLALANVALNAIADGPKGASAAIGQIVQRLSGKDNKDAKSAIATVVAGAATGMGQQLVTRTTGAILNPNMELLFNNPALRQFTFQFQLSARQREESKEIVRILRFFKQGSSVKRSGSNLFLKSPHTYKIQYLHRNGTDNPFINKIKEVACTGINVDYTPNNNYATFPDGAMTSYGLTLQFQELTPVYDDDYRDESDLSIGF